MEEGIVGIRQVPATQPVSIIPISVCLGRTCCCYQLKHRCCIHLQYYSCDEYHIRKTLWYTQWLKKCKPLHFCRKKLLNTIFLHLQCTDYTFFAWKIGAFQVKSGARGIQNFLHDSFTTSAGRLNCTWSNSWDANRVTVTAAGACGIKLPARQWGRQVTMSLPECSEQYQQRMSVSLCTAADMQWQWRTAVYSVPLHNTTQVPTILWWWNSRTFQGPWSCLFKEQFSMEVYSMGSITAILNICFCDYRTVLVDKNKTWQLLANLVLGKLTKCNLE